MKRILLGLAASAAVAAPLALVTTPADAATNTPCMTRAEFARIHTGMTVTQVKRIVGSAGSVSLSSPPMVIRNHRTGAAGFRASSISDAHTERPGSRPCGTPGCDPQSLNTPACQPPGGGPPLATSRWWT